MNEAIVKLVEQAQSGDERAMSQLIEATQDSLFKFMILLCGNESLAQDICQDTYIMVLKKLKTLKQPGSFNSWLRLIAKNLYIDHVRRPANKSSEFKEEYMGSYEQSTDKYLVLRHIMDKLDPEERLVLLLTELEGYKNEEAAEIAGISESAFKSRLLRARKKVADIAEKIESKKWLKSS